MAINRFTVCLPNDSLLPRDCAVNVLYYDVTVPDTHGGVMDDISACYVGLAPWLNSAFAGPLEIKAYDEGPGAPKEVRTYPINPVGALGPTEVALCLSYSADDGVTGAPRRRGRIYLPIVQAAVRPTPSGAIAAVLDFGVALSQCGTFDNTNWKLKSGGAGSFPARPAEYKQIESISCDDEWDTQRRRGMRSTQRIRRDVG